MNTFPESYPMSQIETQRKPKLMERVVSFFRTRINAAVSAATLPAVGGLALGALSFGPIGAAAGAAIAAAPFLVGGYKFGKRVENAMYGRPNLYAPSRLENVSASIALKVNETIKQAGNYALVAGTAGLALTGNPGIGLASGIAGGIAGAVGGWNFGRTMKDNIARADAVTNSAYPSIISNFSPVGFGTNFLPSPMPAPVGV